MYKLTINGASEVYAMRKETIDITQRKKQTLHGEAQYPLL